MRPDGRLLVWRQGWVNGGAAPSPNGAGGALSQVLSDAAGMLCAPMAACWYGGQGTTTGPQKPAPSTQGWPPRTKAARVPQSPDGWG